MGMTEMSERDPHRIQPWNDADDRAKLAQLIDSMETNGWAGAPVLVITEPDGDPIAITGSHRIHAARQADIDVPTVDLADLLTEHGHNLDALIGEYTDAGLNYEDARYEVICRLDEHLPAEVAENYGIDAH